MRMVSERVARRANAEDETTGRFWQGRFKMQELCDEIAILACLMYVDLNPIRAGMASSPENSEFTSAKRRIDLKIATEDGSCLPPAWLAELTLNESGSPGPHASTSTARCSDKGFLPIGLGDYLVLLDWTGRKGQAGKTGAIPISVASILERMQVKPGNWLKVVCEFDRLFYRMVGRPVTLANHAHQHGRRWYQAPGGHLLSSSAV